MRFCGQCGSPASTAIADHTSAGRLPEQRRLITALFADLSGFTSLSERLDPETLSEIIGEVIRTLAEIVERFGGTVLNYAGDAVLAGFGVPESAGDDASRALAAALEMRDTVPALPAARGLTLHIGVNTGHAVARYTGSSGHVAYTILGDAVNSAQRLEAAAPTGEIYVGPLTARLAGPWFDLEPIGGLQVKGRTEKLDAWRLVGARAGVPAAGAGGAELVGRHAELAAVSGLGLGCRVAAVVGEPGVGKTALVQEAVRRRPEVRWVIAGAVPHLSEAYGVWRTVTRALLDDQRWAELWEPGASGDSESRRRRLHGGVVAAVRAARPVVVVIEDLHWVDPASLDLARELAFELGLLDDQETVGLLVTTRPEGAETGATLLGEVPEARATQLTLEGLGPEELRVLVAALLGGPSTDALVDLVAAHTGGVAFFATELVRLLRETGRIAAPDGTWEIADPELGAHIPPTVEQLVQSRVDRLPRRSRSVLELAAVIGAVVPIPLLEQVLPGARAPGLASLVDHGLVDLDASRASVTFRHGIVRDVVYHSTLRSTRRRLHAEVADAIEAGGGTDSSTLAQLAHHLTGAEAGLRAVDALVAAADAAAALFANESAHELLDRAVELGARHDLEATRLAGLRLRRASTAHVLGRFVAAMADFRAVASQPGEDQGQRRRALLGTAHAAASQGEFDDALAVLDELVADRPDTDVESVIERGFVLLSAGRVAEAVELCTEALAEDLSPADRVTVLLRRAQALDNLGRTDEALADAREAHALAPGVGDPGLDLAVRRVLGGLLVDVDRFDEAEAILRDGLDRATAGGATFEIAGCLISLAFLEQRRGDAHAAIELDRRAVRELHRIRAAFEAGALANLAHKLADVEDWQGAGAAARDAVACAVRLGDELARADALYAVGRVALAIGDRGEGTRALEASLAILHSLGALAMVDDIESLLATALTPGSSPD